MAYDGLPTELQDWYYTAEPKLDYIFSGPGSIFDFDSYNQGEGYCGHATVVKCFNGDAETGKTLLQLFVVLHVLDLKPPSINSSKFFFFNEYLLKFVWIFVKFIDEYC